MTELALIKMTRPETASDPEALISRMDRIERRLRGETVLPTTPAPEAPVAKPTAEAPAEPAAVEPAPAEPSKMEAPGEAGAEPEEGPDGSIDVTLDGLVKVWPGLFGSLKDVLGARRWALFKEAVPGAVEGRTIILEVPAGFHLNALQEDDAVARIVATKASDLLGTQVRIAFRARGAAANPNDQIDLDELEERPVADPETLLATELGARIVEE